MATPNAYGGGYGQWVNAPQQRPSQPASAPARANPYRQAAQRQTAQTTQRQPYLQPATSYLQPKNAPQQQQMLPAPQARVVTQPKVVVVQPQEQPKDQPKAGTAQSFGLGQQDMSQFFSSKGGKKPARGRKGARQEQRPAPAAKATVTGAPWIPGFIAGTAPPLAQYLKPDSAGLPVKAETLQQIKDNQTGKKAAGFEKLTKTREISDKEWKSLTPDQRKLIEFNTLFVDTRAKADKGDKAASDALANLEKGLQLEGVSSSDFLKGRAVITDEDLWGPGGRPGRTGTAQQITWGKNMGAVPMKMGDRENLVRLISENVNKFFTKVGGANAQQLNTTLGQNNALPQTAGLPGVQAPQAAVAPDLSKYGLNQQQLDFLANTFETSTQKQSWGFKGDYDALANTLKGANIPMDAFAEYAGTMVEQRRAAKQPLSGDAKTALDYDDYFKKAGIRVR